MNKKPDMPNFSKFFAYRYRISEQAYADVCNIRLGESSEEFFKMSGNYLDQSNRNILHNVSDDVEVQPGALISYYDTSAKEVVYKDIFNSYKFNSSGYRMPDELSWSEEFIFAGCSHTVGEGVPEETVWGVQTANALGMSWANLAVAGRSVVWAVDNIFAYLQECKTKPKVVALLLPQFNRFQVVNNPLSMISRFTGVDKKAVASHGIAVASLLESYFNSSPKYSERPHWAEDVINAETMYMYNLRPLKYLAMYCEAAGIKFVWSTWSEEDYWILDQYKEYLNIENNFVPIKTTSWYSTAETGWKEELHSGEYFLPEIDLHHGHPLPSKHYKRNEKGSCIEGCTVLNCHQELEEKYGWNFHIGTDKHTTPQNSHFGVHKHTHFAEEFIKALL